VRAVLAVAREQGGIGACETLAAGTWPTLLADYRIRMREAHQAAEAANDGRQNRRNRLRNS
jgi:hypothetical protein